MLLFLFLATLILADSLSVPSLNNNNCRIKVCHNKDCVKKGGGERLVDIFHDLIPNEASGVTIESSGCLSQCGNGPNVLVEANGEKEKIYFDVNDPTSASAVLEVATGEDYPINLLVAADYIFQSESAGTSPSKRESLLSSAIEEVTKDQDTAQHFAWSHALYLRADARLDLSPQDVEGAIADALLASQLSPTDFRVWRVLANAQEAGGEVEKAINALREGARVDPSFATKAKNEIRRLSSLRD